MTGRRQALRCHVRLFGHGYTGVGVACIIRCMDEAMRIAFVITDLHVGGSPRMLRDLVAGLKKGGEFAPEVVSLMPLRAKEENVAGAMQAAGVPVHLLHLTSALDVVRGVMRLVKVLNGIRPQIVVSILIHANALTT